MRLAWLCVLAAGCRIDSGAQLSFVAPQGPTAAASLELVLASVELVPVVPDQRKGPHTTETEAVTYYLEQSRAGVSPDRTSISRVDGFTVRIAPDPSVPETAFVPFALLRDASGTLVGIGTYHARGIQTPSPIVVQAGEIDTYAIDVEPVTEVDGSQALAHRNVLDVACERQDQTRFESGIAWRPDAGGQVRLLFPDAPGGLDATQRSLDLDCDGHAVTAAASSTDCDDTSAAFYAGAPEACDGLDTNCDGQPYLVLGCAPSSGNVCLDPATGMGIALCDDTTGMVGACQDDPGCACTTGIGACRQCAIAHAVVTVPGQLEPCQPGVGTLSTPTGLCDGGTCSVEVVAVRGGWEAQVAADDASPFDTLATAVGSSFAIKVRRPEGPGAVIPGAPGAQTGEVDLVVVAPGSAPQLLGVSLAFDGDLATACPGTGPFQMHCAP